MEAADSHSIQHEQPEGSGVLTFRPGAAGRIEVSISGRLGGSWVYPTNPTRTMPTPP
jgi:hypothetical protein